MKYNASLSRRVRCKADWFRVLKGRVGVNSRYSRRSFVGRFGGALPLAAWAQQVRPPSMKRIGFLIGGEKTLMDAFNNELRRLGYVEGRNIAVEIRITRPNSSDNVKYAAEFARLDLELVVVAALPGALELRKANPAMPSGDRDLSGHG